MNITEDIQIEPALEGESLAATAAEVDAFEGYEKPHASRIAALAEGVGHEFGLARGDLQSLKHAAMLHDVGEAVMARAYIAVENPLELRERLDLERHPVIGEQEAAKTGHSRAVQLLIRWHHEWWDGSGYPDRLSGRQIPLAARILRLCDTYSALTSKRPFRGAFSADEAERYLAEAAGIEFDPTVVRVALSMSDEFRQSETGNDRSAMDADPGTADDPAS